MYIREVDVDLATFVENVNQASAPTPLASTTRKNVPVYDVSSWSQAAPDNLRAFQTEWADVLRSGAGVIVLSGAYTDTTIVDRVSKAFLQIIETERSEGGGQGDHFAKAGANARIWNALQKLCLSAPQAYAEYHANIAIDAVSAAWLGPFYQMTSQVNLVRPGGAAQAAHRDYHLGFQTAQVCADIPIHAHELSPMLTLQGAVAHCDMPVESGPTKLLPGSQRYREGYLAWRRDDFREYFESNYIQLPLNKGDAVFFNPALFHAAGDNTTTDIERMANLLQVSSAYGRAMESIDRDAMCTTLYPVLRELAPSLGEARVAALIAATAEGYSFPTNLDNDPPINGLAPKTQADIVHECLANQGDADTLRAELDALNQRRRA